MFKNIYDIGNKKYYPIKSDRGVEILKSYINKMGGSNITQRGGQKSSPNYYINYPVMINHLKCKINKEYLHENQSPNKEFLLISDIHLNLPSCKKYNPILVHKKNSINLEHFLQIFFTNVNTCLDIFIEDRHIYYKQYGGSDVLDLPIDIIRKHLAVRTKKNLRIHKTDNRQTVFVDNEMNFNTENSFDFNVKKSKKFKSVKSKNNFINKLIDTLLFGNLDKHFLNTFFTEQGFDMDIDLHIKFLNQTKIRIKKQEVLNNSIRDVIIKVFKLRIKDELSQYYSKSKLKLSTDDIENILFYIHIFVVDMYTLYRMFRIFDETKRNICKENESMTKIVGYYGAFHIENYVNVIRQLAIENIITLEKDAIYAYNSNIVNIHKRNYGKVVGCVPIPINTKIFGIYPDRYIKSVHKIDCSTFKNNTGKKCPQCCSKQPNCQWINRAIGCKNK